MTKKDYEQLVRIIRRNSNMMGDDEGVHTLVMHTRMFVQDLTLRMKHDNNTFDEEKFRKAVFK